MRDHTKLRAFELGDEVAVLIYRVTEGFPREESYGLTSQMRRAAVSVPSNIVEGCGQLDNGNLIRFLGIAKGSAFETEYQLLLAKDLNYITNEEYKFLMAKIQSIIHMLIALIKSLKNLKPVTRNLKQDDRRES